MEIEAVIGANIAEAREQRGVTQGELGKQLGRYLEKDWSRQMVWAAERGKRAFTAVELVAFAHVLSVGVDQLLTPGVEVRAIDMPSGATISRSELFEATLPSEPVREVFHDMQQALADLVEDLSRAHDRAGSIGTQLDQARRLTK
ncbi:helix-turn-helix domain-containing protein [Amycolatopsis tucumanensis]|uniref:HTH cro/C1-type domain-containing protein n=1 Tax=Amycolatopsis tucumanensis TaxID=401106 RepID=A0ABP7IWT4_9PSEU|nr:helix-turn-helix transcriptional regulator [Amycolatopsis tucumanensis]MCF6423344.1 helix-turn-helix transcriptional regulator [Amycolatopsis tucumanensis]